MPNMFRRVIKDINEMEQTSLYDATSTWKSHDEELLGGRIAKNFGVVVEHFHSKPKVPFNVSGTGMQIKDTSILVEIPDNYPFSPPQITFIRALIRAVATLARRLRTGHQSSVCRITCRLSSKSSILPLPCRGEAEGLTPWLLMLETADLSAAWVPNFRGWSSQRESRAGR